MSAPVVSDQANWRDELTPEARKEAKNFLVSKLQRNLPRDKLLAYSQRHEGNCYDKATSISNYILLVCEPVDIFEYQLQQKQAAKAAHAAKQAAAGEQAASSMGQPHSSLKPGVQMSGRPKAQQAQVQARNDLNGMQNVDHEQRGSVKMEPTAAVQNSQYPPDSASFYQDAQAPKMTSQVNPNVMRQSGVSPQQQQPRMQPRQMVQQQQQPPQASAQAQQPPQQQQPLSADGRSRNIADRYEEFRRVYQQNFHVYVRYWLGADAQNEVSSEDPQAAKQRKETRDKLRMFDMYLNTEYAKLPRGLQKPRNLENFMSFVQRKVLDLKQRKQASARNRAAAPANQ
ncbi:hypothetical protein NDN08_001572 [Rhodosorus marinus]|uniref:Mediator complex subunit 15 KIX domain-containing protein n=1 Tax=Rhodosorus marinus TaxID=101924 RepID=A0AAV8UR90_9RHOD|nr:hypothetical protein NDN08_001572 [Rhodosorus marinus]